MTSRKVFLGASALAALVPVAAEAAGSPAPSPSPSPEPTLPPLAFDLPAFDAACARPAQHRHMFASTKLSGGVVLDAVKNTIDAYASIGVSASTVATSVVLYHGLSIGIALDDGVWKDLIVPAIPKMPDGMRPDTDAYKGATGNPFHDAVASGGTLFYVCNNAVKGFAHLFASLTKRSTLDVYQQISKGLLSGATLVPAGVWAVHALQERRFTYLQTTL